MVERGHKLCWIHTTPNYTLLNKINILVLVECYLLKFTVIHYSAYADSMSNTAAKNTMKYTVILFA